MNVNILINSCVKLLGRCVFWMYSSVTTSRVKINREGRKKETTYLMQQRWCGFLEFNLQWKTYNQLTYMLFINKIIQTRSFNCLFNRLFFILFILLKGYRQIQNWYLSDQTCWTTAEHIFYMWLIAVSIKCRKHKKQQ